MARKAAPKQPKNTIPIQILAYGRAGVGKTTFAASGIGDPRFDDVLILDCEGGWPAVASKVEVIEIEDFPTFTPEPGVGTVVRITAVDQLEAIYEMELANPRFRTRVLDSLTDINYMALNETMQEVCAKDRTRSMFKPQRDDYGTALGKMRAVIRAYRSLPGHLVMTAGLYRAGDDNRLLIPSLVGQLREEAPSMVMAVGYYTIINEEDGDGGETPKHIMLFGGDERHYGKDRFEGHRLTDEVEDPTLPSLLDRLTEVTN
jgi:hypothetical protein